MDWPSFIIGVGVGFGIAQLLILWKLRDKP